MSFMINLKIAKGPFAQAHQHRALLQVMQARLLNQVTKDETHTWYLALLNLENYLDRLAQSKLH